MSFNIHICGCRGTFPTFNEQFKKYGQDTSCYVISETDYAIIIDCGTGLYNSIPYIKDCKKIDIILSHVHYDHIMGLFDSEKIFANKEITFYGKFDEWFSNKDSKVRLYNSEDFIKGNRKQVVINKKIKLSYGYEIKFRDSSHEENSMMIEIFKDNKHIVYTGDYEHHNTFNIKDIILDCDVLLFDGSYSQKDYRKYKGWGHSTIEEGCDLAKKYNVKKLIITHHAPFYDDYNLTKKEEEIKKIYDNVEFAKQNGVIEL